MQEILKEIKDEATRNLCKAALELTVFNLDDIDYIIENHLNYIQTDQRFRMLLD